ncbi:nuclear transport factor 2 family protein [Scleromatobacter humisilvae]|uniref:Nuclear transport factor 2 family protein n=1 Tax=Scleromatobacter humisilvae TaxID=2897159 RepID=A0A9X1YNS5_9BURK|nr:nuclear transport factor 2 family protein [Scleromatobacter humisilvae]MCK9689456.1 nuclear transport factor 2 family protein [Scleromatobacter humisilvae]
MFLSDLPSPIAAFVSAARAGEGGSLLSALHAVDVVTEGQCEHRGADIHAWGERLGSGSIALRPIGARQQHGDIVVTLWLELEEERRQADTLLDFHFRMDSGRLAQISVGPTPRPRMPPPVDDYIRATNRGDLVSLVSAFANDALVNDQLRDYWGRREIESWAARDIIGEQLTMHVVDCVYHYDHVIVTAHIDGTFDKRGLPDPLAMAFYFAARGDKIVQLIILRNQSGT